MTPMFFGERTRKLYGVYQPAQSGMPRKRAAVLCYPWGPEYTEAHRAVRRLATLLSAAGIHTLRFDYYGTGDSGGELLDGDVQGWEADIATAMDELSDMTGMARVSLIGLRLGALLAADVATQRARRVDSLVLWDPILSGAAYPAELRSTAKNGDVKFTLPGPRPAALGGGFDVLGFPISNKLLSQLGALELELLAPKLPKGTLAVVSTASTAARDMLTVLPSVDVKHIAAEPCWVDNWPLRTALPVHVLQALADWLA